MEKPEISPETAPHESPRFRYFDLVMAGFVTQQSQLEPEFS